MTHRSPIAARTAIGVAAVLALYSTASQGQTAATAPGSAAPAASAASSPEPDDTQPQRVIVTAQKRPQFADQVPMSLSAVSGEQLQQQGVSDMVDLGRLSPGLSVNTSTSLGQPNIAIRGISSQSGAATTALYIDDAPIQVRTLSNVVGGSAFPQIFDLDRVEVLRGPQGTLFGSSAEGGAIRFITPLPRSNQTSGNVRVGFGVTPGGSPSYDTGVAVGGSIDGTDSELYRVSLSEGHEGGYMDRVDRTTGDVIDHNTNKRDSTVMRGVLQLRPNAQWTITPAVFLQQTKDADRNIAYEEAGTFKTYNMIPQPTKDEFSLSSLSVGYDTDALSFKSVTSFFDRTQNRVDDYSYTNGAIYLGTEVVPGLADYVSLNRMITRQRNIAQEFRLASGDDPQASSSWIVGAYASRALVTADQSTAEDLNRWTDTVFGAPAADLPELFSSGPIGAYSYLENDNLKDRTEALFGEYTRKLDAKTTAVMGLRVGTNEYAFSSLEQGAYAPNGYALVQGSKRDNSVLPKISLTRDVTPSDMVYATVATGDRPGGGNPPLAGYVACQGDLSTLGISEVKPTYDADKLLSYELGYKGREFGQSLEVAAALFYIDWKKIQTRVILPTCQFAFIANAGQARSAGADVQLQWHLSRQFSITASAAYTNAQYEKTVYADGTATGSGDPIVRSGQPLPSPRVSATFGAEYGWALSTATHAFIRGDYQYASSYKRTGAPGAYDYDPGVYTAPSTNFFSLNTGLSSGAYDWNFSVLNLTNNRTELLRFRYTPVDPSFQSTTFRPRTFSASMNYKF